MDAKETKKALESWFNLNAALRLANEDECNRLLQRERAGQRRYLFLQRIHGRFSKLRWARERRELLREANEANEAPEVMKKDYERGNWEN